MRSVEVSDSARRRLFEAEGDFVEARIAPADYYFSPPPAPFSLRRGWSLDEGLFGLK